MACWFRDNNIWRTQSLENVFHDQDFYLCCPGPSLKGVDAESLHVPGSVVFAINSAYPLVHPDIWIGMDAVECYESSIYYESFLKIMRRPFGETKFGQGQICDKSSMFFIDVDDKFGLEDMFKQRGSEPTFMWKKNTMFAAIHVALWMGAKRIYLVGSDFGGKEDYCDDRVLSEPNRNINRGVYDYIVKGLPVLRKLAEDNGVEILSSTPNSKANGALDYVPLKEALVKTRGRVPAPITKPITPRDREHVHWSDGKHVRGYGVITGVSQANENHLERWYADYRKYNNLPVAFADFGMSDNARAFCKKNEQVLNIGSVNEVLEHDWQKKPFAIMQSTFGSGLWIDLECEILNDVQPLLNSLFATRREVGALLNDGLYNASVFGFGNRSPLIQWWAKKTIAEPKDWDCDHTLLTALIQRLGDHGVLPWGKNVIIKGAAKPETIIRIVRLVQETGDYDPDSWMSKDEVDALLKYSIDATGDIVEIGTFLGGTARMLAKANPDKTIWTIDSYAEQRAARNPVAVSQSMKENIIPIIARAVDVGKTWQNPVGLLFHDGSHNPDDIRGDLDEWLPHLDGVLAIHDAVDIADQHKIAINGRHLPGDKRIAKFVPTIEGWKVIETVDSLVFMRRVA